MGFTQGTFGKNDATGWSTFTPTQPWVIGVTAPAPAGTRIICVDYNAPDNGAGGENAANDGSLAHPFKFLKTATATYGRGGKPDWILLKRGVTWPESASNVFTDNVGFSPSTWAYGQDASNLLLFSNYDPSITTTDSQGTYPVPDPQTSALARPTVNISGVNGPAFYFGDHGPGWYILTDYMAVVGIKFYNFECDNILNATPDYTKVTDGIHIEGTGTLFFLIENCLFTGGCSLSLQGQAQDNSQYVIRRNVIDRVNGPDQKTIGLYLGSSYAVGRYTLLEENVIYRGGWNGNVVPVNNAIFNHNFYNSDGGGPSPELGSQPIIVRANFLIDDPSGVQFRSGGTYYDNCMIGGNYFAYEWCPWSSGTIASETSYNVFTELGRGGFWGLSTGDLGWAQKSWVGQPSHRGNYYGNNVHDNIFCNTGYANTSTATFIYCYCSANNVNMSNNVLYNLKFTAEKWGFYNGSIISIKNLVGGTVSGADGAVVVPVSVTVGGAPTFTAYVTANITAGTVSSIGIWSGTSQFGTDHDSQYIGGAGYSGAWTLSLDFTGTGRTASGISFQADVLSSGNTYDVSNEYEHAAGTYPNPSRTVGTYTQSIGQGTTTDNFVTYLVQREKTNWSSDRTAMVVNNYFRSGFGKALLAYDVVIHHGGNHLGKF